MPPGNGWTQDPYGAAIIDGFLYGRGAAVSKSDFATYAFALDALRRADLPLRGTVELHLTYDEEIGGAVGPGWLLAQRLTAPDMVISAGFSYAVVVAHNGCLHLEIEVTGRSAHAALPGTGVDALEAATRILAMLYASREDLARTVSRTDGIGAPQLTVGLIAGGINTNVVPDRVTLRLDRRIIPEEDPVAVEAALTGAIVAAGEGVAGATVAVRRILLARPLIASEGALRLAETIGRHAEARLGRPVRPTGVPLFTDARLYAEAGIPIVLYGAGPRSVEEANGHRADERLALIDLRAATEIVAATLADLLA